jgi:hypothetical protein
MTLVADRKKKTDAKSGRKSDPHRGVQIPLRLPDSRLVDALDEYAEQIRRSRNMAIVLLLEEAMKTAGLWPPPDPN